MVEQTHWKKKEERWAKRERVATPKNRDITRQLQEDLKQLQEQNQESEIQISEREIKERAEQKLIPFMESLRLMKHEKSQLNSTAASTKQNQRHLLHTNVRTQSFDTTEEYQNPFAARTGFSKYSSKVLSRSTSKSSPTTPETYLSTNLSRWTLEEVLAKLSDSPPVVCVASVWAFERLVSVCCYNDESKFACAEVWFMRSAVVKFYVLGLLLCIFSC